MDEPTVSDVVRELQDPQTAAEIAAVYDGQVVSPGRVVADRPEDENREFPGWPSPVLVRQVENQGVCAWGTTRLGQDQIARSRDG